MLNLLLSRSEFAHKGEVGHVAVLAGSNVMLGASVLTSLAVLRSGAGAVSLLTVPLGQGTINVTYPELMVHAIPDLEGCLDPASLPSILKVLKDSYPDVVAIGPGLGNRESVRACLKALYQERLLFNMLKVIDADGLIPAFDWSVYPENTCVLTPHVGEFKRLFPDLSKGADFKDEESRLQLALNAAERTRQIVILKGKGTVVASSDACFVNDTGNSGMATAGSGDVLTGLIAGFIGQGLKPYEAACLGVQIHGQAGDYAYDWEGNALMASDLLDCIPEVLTALSSDSELSDDQ